MLVSKKVNQKKMKFYFVIMLCRNGHLVCSFSLCSQKQLLVTGKLKTFFFVLNNECNGVPNNFLKLFENTFEYFAHCHAIFQPSLNIAKERISHYNIFQIYNTVLLSHYVNVYSGGRLVEMDETRYFQLNEIPSKLFTICMGV